VTDSLPPDRDGDVVEQTPAEGAVSPGFAALGLDQRLLQTLADLGYEEPTPIQLAAIPPLLRGSDLLAEAPTGTGKTAAFALPILQRLAVRLDEGRAAGTSVEARGAAGQGKGARPSALVLAPTRELAMQVAEAIHKYGKRLGVRVVPVYGGQPITTQLHRLARGVDVVVATPGRAVDHLDRGTLRFEDVDTVVLDEADEMLDMGFADDLERILGSLREIRQTALFSATIAGQIARLAERHLRHPARVQVHAEAAAAGEPARVRQVAYVVRRADKLTALGRILDLEDGAATLVFARTRGEVDDLAEALSGRGRDAAALHGGLSQEQRDRIMARFRAGELDVLVATDVAARGLDISTVTHVINFDVPVSPDIYVHRIGRTGRVGRSGRALTFVEPRQQRELEAIERHIGTTIEPWSAGAHTPPAPVSERPRRHTKPQLSRNGDEPYATLIASSGRASGIEVADLVHAVTAAAGIDGEAVRDVRVLERFSLLTVPRSEADRVVEAVAGAEVNGAALRLEVARG
jgi:ATP-dependent RNA helicase DeaD